MRYVPFRNSLFTPAADGGMYVHDYGYDPVCDWVLANQTIYEHYVLMMISPILASSASLVDLGCHVGTYGYAAQLLQPNISVFSIDANQRNIEMCKLNSINRTNHKFLCGFWKGNSELEHIYIQNPEILGHSELYNGLSELRQSEDQVVVQTVNDMDIVDFMIGRCNLSPKHHFVKVDVDGGEVGNITSLLELIAANDIATYVLLETADFLTFHQVKSLGFVPLALLPGNNFLFCSPILVHTMSTTIFLATTVAYLNVLIDNQQFLNSIAMQGSFVDEKPFGIRSAFGISQLSGRILNDYWQDLLRDQAIPLFCYG